ncbi:ribosome maturation factor RimM [Buchananella hordeovulneris]|uniref:ribosome maturation factor RimM n=1 Tax=Buchananella hordeovulneris TaxID=52770 RepID=UPI000F5D95E4|nr:ribosome maturation factor RimM [Buchananella hordeovulneris]RRD44925.1 ribosome maturation factor RimM [Buchananella hordeovulneris]RRD52508.1 ribosome maturation factor RimM [Buchananella hordeovulneris]
MLLTVAVIGAAHGLRGEVRLDVRTDDPRGRLTGGAVFATEDPRHPTLTLQRVRRDGPRTFASFAGITDRTAAEGLRGIALLIDPAGEELEADEFYPHELRGLAALDPEGSSLGTVKDLLPGAAQDILVIDTGADEVLVPFVAELVPEVDLAGGRVIIDPPGGLFPGRGQAVS